jgi:hypothetical protein
MSPRSTNVVVIAEPPKQNNTRISWIVFAFLGLLVVALIVLIGILATKLNAANQNNAVLTPVTVTPADTASADCLASVTDLKALVNTFWDLETAHDGAGVLALFTKIDTSTDGGQGDQNVYNYLTGTDTNTGMRLYADFGSGTLYNLTSSQLIGDNYTPSGATSPLYCTMQGVESRANYGGPTNPVYLDPMDSTVYFTFAREDGVWKIADYSGFADTEPQQKFSAFEGTLYVNYAN